MTSPASRAATSTRTWWIVGTIGVLLMSALAVWFGIAATVGRVHWSDAGFKVMADDRVEVRFDLTRDPDRSVVCLLQAQDERHAVVGSVETTIGAVASSPSRHIATVRTAGPAVAGHVERCRYADDE